ncbi:hypothetical protein AAF712_001684 [Marasmius tenuissimus]|uniref:RNI-like protein n=1 Tax=Marasmius tenuissimus TaxID=585030 RepID=A0ABR3AB45_9AGAR
MSSSSSSPSPSSSAVTIQIPGKSILKKPPPPQTSLFSRITRFLPQSQAGGSTFGIKSSTAGAGGNGGSGNAGNENGVDDGRPLKRAHFILPQIATVYPISSANPPYMPTLKEEKRTIEEREAERRRRVVRGNSVSLGSGTDVDDEWWSMDKVDSFYKECCAGCDEHPDPAISAALKNAENTNPRSVDLSGVQLTFTSASILADVFTIEWGLRKLVFRECDLDEHTLKPILHALLIPNSLTFLSVASNRRLKPPAFRLIGAYLGKAVSLQFLDLSQTPLDKKSIEYIVASFSQPPSPGLASLRLDDCSLKPGALDVLAKVVRTSSLRNISLRHNKINATGAIALSVMIRDYPDSIPATGPIASPASPNLSSQTSFPSSLLLSPTSSQASSTLIGSDTPTSSLTPSPASSVTSLPLTSSMTPHQPPPQPHAGPILPPPTHPSLQPMQTTYTPYVPRSKRGKPTTSSTTPTPGSPNLGNVVITTSVRGGVTAVTANGVSSAVDKVTSAVKGNGTRTAQGRGSYSQGPSAALLDKVRALDSLPRLGSLRTLDLRGNDLRTGTTYLAQVLKRNRTLRVLNLSENKLDVACLVAIADALKYNTCLETLDLSRNPCCGSGSSSGSGSLTRDRDRSLYRDTATSRTDKSPSDLEGIQSLRMSLTLTTSLKRLFLSSTNLSTQGAIALAEFLPESRSLLHLDLTGNPDLGVAGVMALNEGLKRNKIVRCLDLEVPPGAEEYTRLCREILNTCIRNTEEAERASQQEQALHQNGGKSKAALWGMIEESELAKSVRMAGDEVGMIDTDVILRARGCIRQLQNFLMNPLQPLYSPSITTPSTPRSPENSGLFSPTSAFASFSMLSVGETKSSDGHSTITPQELIDKARTVTNELASVIAQIMNGEGGEVEPERLEELLGISDELTESVAKVEEFTRSQARHQEAGSGDPDPKPGRLSLNLKGLGLNFPGADNQNHGVRVPGAPPGGSVTLPSHDDSDSDNVPSPTTPKVDKGKQRADPEPIEHEKVLSPTTSFLDSPTGSDEDEEEGEMDRFPPFRVPEPGEEGYTPEIDQVSLPLQPPGLGTGWKKKGKSSGKVMSFWARRRWRESMLERIFEERSVLLEATVERSAPRALNVDEFGVEIPPEVTEQQETVEELPEPSKPAPRPYVPRRSSSASIMSLVSPTIEKAASTPLPASPRVDPFLPARIEKPHANIIAARNTNKGDE